MAIQHPFYFLRHGETTWNAAGRTQGQLDAPLSERGREQAARAAEILRGEPVSRIVASPLSRARDTAEAAARTTGAPISFDDALMEFHAGEWQGEFRGENIAPYFAGELDPPGGETFKDFAARGWAALTKAAAEPGTLIVCHGGIWRAAMAYVTITPLLSPMPNALPVLVRPSADGWSAEVLGADQP